MTIHDGQWRVMGFNGENNVNSEDLWLNNHGIYNDGIVWHNVKL